MKALRPYMGYAGEPDDGAVLIFAHTAREARHVGFPLVSGWFDCQWLDMRARRLRGNDDYLRTLGDQGKLDASTAHAIDDVPVCHLCETWGSPLDENDVCERCNSEVESLNG